MDDDELRRCGVRARPPQPLLASAAGNRLSWAIPITGSAARDAAARVVAEFGGAVSSVDPRANDDFCRERIRLSVVPDGLGCVRFTHWNRPAAQLDNEQWVNVRRGHTVGNLVEVDGDLKPGDEIVERGTDEIREGTELKGSKE